MPTKPATVHELDEQAVATAEALPLIEGVAPNIIVALTRVMRDMPGIGRDATSEQGYQYRGIEAITAQVQRLLAKHGVVYVPEVIQRDEVELTINNRPWTEQRATIQYRIYGPGGIEDHITAGPFVAQGRDNSDKGMNKCMTQAFKYALLQTLCIGDSKDDADAGPAHEADQRTAAVDPVHQARADVGARLRSESVAVRDAVREFCDEHKIPRVPARWSDDELEQVIEQIDALTAPEADSAPDTPETGSETATGTTDPDPGQACGMLGCDTPAVVVSPEGEAFCEDHAPAELFPTEDVS